MPFLSAAQCACLRELRNMELLTHLCADETGLPAAELGDKVGLSSAQVGASMRVLREHGLAERLEGGFKLVGASDLQTRVWTKRIYRLTERGREWLDKREPSPSPPPPGHLSIRTSERVVRPRESSLCRTPHPGSGSLSRVRGALRLRESGRWLKPLLAQATLAHASLHALAEQLEPGLMSSLTGAASTSPSELSLLTGCSPPPVSASLSGAASQLAEAFVKLYRERDKVCAELGWSPELYQRLLEDLREVSRAEKAGPGRLSEPHRLAICRLEWDLMCVNRALSGAYERTPAGLHRAMLKMGVPAPLALTLAPAAKHLMDWLDKETS